MKGNIVFEPAEKNKKKYIYNGGCVGFEPTIDLHPQDVLDPG